MADLHAYLEELIDLRRDCTIRFRADNEAVSELKARILNVHNRENVVYITLDNGLDIRAERIVTINGNPLQALS